MVDWCCAYFAMSFCSAGSTGGGGGGGGRLTMLLVTLVANRTVNIIMIKSLFSGGGKAQDGVSPRYFLRNVKWSRVMAQMQVEAASRKLQKQCSVAWKNNIKPSQH